MPILDLIKSKNKEEILYVIFNPKEHLLSREEMNNKTMKESKGDFNLRELVLKMIPSIKVVGLTFKSIAFYETIDTNLLDKLRAIVSYPLDICKIKISLNESRMEKNENKIVIKDIGYKNLNGYEFLINNLFYEVIHNNHKIILDVYYFDSKDYYPREISYEFGLYALDFWSYKIYSEIAENNPKSVIWQIGQQDFAMMHNPNNIPGFFVEFANKEYHISKAKVDISLV